MSTPPISLHIPEEIRASVEEIARRTGRDFSSVANELLAEAVRMRQVPGIAFADSPSGRVARVAGTNIQVWQITEAYRNMDGNRERLRRVYDWLSEQELHTALAYAEAYPDEIEERLRREEAWTPERIWTTYPPMRPAGR